MNTLMLAVLVCVVATVRALPASFNNEYTFPYVSREEWGAEPPTLIAETTEPVPFVIIHHTYIPAACPTRKLCIKSMKSMQRAHQLDNEWADIGYNFAIGGDGAVYEGRGWGIVGAHAAGWNAMSVGIVFIGDFQKVIPNTEQIEVAQKLIDYGVSAGYIVKNYQLLGHRQVTPTECPGQQLFKEIKNWDRFTSSPYVPEKLRER